jgi:hypothetical protein
MGLCLFIGGSGLSAAQDLGQLKSTASDVFKVLRFQGHFVRWQQRSGGTSLSLDITYKVVAGPQAFLDARNCRAMTVVDGLLAASGIERSTFESELATAFAMWEPVTKLKFRKVRDGEPASILIGAQVDPVGWAFADVFYDATSPRHIKPISQALICLNPKRSWKVGFDGNLKAYDLRYTFLHEIGHVIGLDHPVGPGQLMDHRYDERFRDLQAGDALGARTLYGAPLKPIPTLSSNSTTSLACCRSRAPKR